MFTGIASHAGALGAALVVLIGAAILHDGPAAADPNQDDRFLALLEKKEIPAVANVPRVIDAAHKVCRKLDGGMPVNDIVDGLRNDAYNIDPVMRLYPVRLTTTMTRFISAAVEIYCPNHHSKMAFAMANFEPGSNEPTHRVAASTRSAVNSGKRPAGVGVGHDHHVAGMAGTDGCDACLGARSGSRGGSPDTESAADSGTAAGGADPDSTPADRGTAATATSAAATAAAPAARG
ncbi:proline rich protein [Mycobacterium tuberculosis KT-0012]|nr:proline rich protein [Mycobacterium tuberculosis KT-0012]